MFCKNCGNEVLDGDKFCGVCGCQQSETGSMPRSGHTRIKVVDAGLIKLCKNYFIKPVSFFSELKGEELLKSSIALLIGLPIIYGILNILYASAFLNSIFSMIQKLPQILASAKIISEQEAARGSQELMMSNEMLEAKSKINALIDNKDIFLGAFAHIFIIMILTAIILAILNAIILKNKINLVDILFLSTASYIPLVISMALASIVTFISIIFGLLILFSGYALSFITLYSGIKQISEENRDKVFMIITILFVLCSALLSIVIVKYIESSLISTMNIFNSFKGLI
ncbi:zinc ribbon domain-containing protein [Clostridium sp. BL-8]|uniref:zinc ribbon domain-containing protein n=1 Tax=Clostridium sp. BL-8 TaxID=349938 RepID=UPI00098C607A|nr:zinc ribbon domain-containing protein [Clostridium sp. BL-8]OOM79058.1 Yip1 domain protein [Clostridium sp. BL-8]